MDVLWNIVVQLGCQSDMFGWNEGLSQPRLSPHGKGVGVLLQGPANSVRWKRKGITSSQVPLHSP